MVPEALRQTKILRLAGEILGFENYALFMVVGAAAMILGLTGFLYLHSKKQIDFYNSLPVKREMLFAVKFLDGFLIILGRLPDQHVRGVWNFLRKRGSRRAIFSR